MDRRTFLDIKPVVRRWRGARVPKRAGILPAGGISAAPMRFMRRDVSFLDLHLTARSDRGKSLFQSSSPFRWVNLAARIHIARSATPRFVSFSTRASFDMSGSRIRAHQSSSSIAAISLHMMREKAAPSMTVRQVAR